MKDIAFVIAYCFFLLFIFKRPYIGACLWAWTALLFPNFLLWGFASNLRFNLIISILTITVALFTSFKLERLNNRIFYLTFLFFLWTIVTSQTAIGNPLVVEMEFQKFAKIFTFFVIVLLTINKKHHIIALLTSILLGLGYYIISGGLKVIISAGSHRVWGPGSSIIGDNNHFALAMLITIPLLFFLYRNSSFNLWIKRAILGCILLSIVAVFGTYSRGGLIGLIFFGGLYSIIFKKKILAISAAVFLASTYAFFVPQQWTDRMDTISDAGKDNSFMSRVVAWKMSTLVAIDRPMLGGGFKAIEGLPVWLLYSQDFEKLNFINTMQPETQRTRAAHSIYFQVMGEHGFFGLTLFLTIIFFSLLNILKSRKLALNDRDTWHKEFADCLLISILVYCLVGAALNMAYFDVLYVLFALSQIQLNLIKKEKSLVNIDDKNNTIHTNTILNKRNIDVIN